MMHKKKKIITNAAELLELLRLTEVRYSAILVSVFLSLIAALFDGLSFVNLLPLLKGIVQMDFSFAKELPILKHIIRLFPFWPAAPNVATFITLLLIVLMAVVLKNISGYFASLMLSYQLRKFCNGLRKIIFDRYLSFGKMFFDKHNMGQLHYILTGLVSNISNSLNSLHQMAREMLTLIVYLVIMVFISWEPAPLRKITFFVFIIFPVLHYTLRWLIKKIKKNSEKRTSSILLLSRNLENILLCIPLVKLYTNEASEKDRFNSLSGQINKLEFSMDKKRYMLEPIREIIMTGFGAFMLSLIALIIVKEKVGDISRFLVYLLLLNRASYAFNALNNFKAQLAIISGEITAVANIMSGEGKFFVKDGALTFNGLKKNIDFRHLTFSYDKTEILKDISFSIEKNKVTAIVGPTGAGKSTIVNLILRFYEYPSSMIFLDGIDIKEFTLHSLRRHIALVSQDILLFDDTIRNNIVYGLNREVPDKELNEIIKKARLYDFVMSLPDKADTYIGDRGVLLSGGEKQRISIARALLKGSEILILDEATSSLDTMTEILIQEAINEAVKERTAIVIAHRLSTIKHADKIIVIEDGNFIEEGTLKELLEKEGRFYQYWQAQKFY